MIEYGGSGDPSRSLALLWRTTERPSRGTKPALTVDRIVRTAIDLADQEGLAALSMRRVADQLGVGTMTLYTHVPGKVELLDVMVDTVYGETSRPDMDGRAWRERLDQVARENLALHSRHPWLLHVPTTRPPLGPNLIAKYDYELRAVADTGLSEVEMDAVLTLVLQYVHGAARVSVEKTRAERETGMTDNDWWAAHQPFLAQIGDAEKYPVAATVGAAAGAAFDGTIDPAFAFEFGLDRLLDGIEVFVSRSADRPSRPAP
ncbi:TetR family transcriptional regulator [Actinosynnema sp. ALI-1.44]|uniref:TetR/AcrR family transcriptional regulator n=1 Tax=Actinosynnema sp. ALI-1.44 TaxID=1933779 RepID=UPI00097BB48C|nr:TetR/AcrR family transcriptional regulator [Actinosynnema sp. ALI-1.44]ONI81079.1 TetR family transcriptional regulator [Actinosynnema sp. ALI-1.44]